jgi:hypothetical protein
LSLTASLAALWSILRTQGEILDQTIFWISMVGVLNTACVGAAIALWGNERFGKSPEHVSAWARLITAIIAVACFTVAAATGAHQLYKTHQDAIDHPDARRVQVSSIAVQNYLNRAGLHRPFVRTDLNTWGYTAGIVLTLYKSGWIVTIEPNWIFMYGEAFARTGQEDCELVFADQKTRLLLEKEHRHTIIAQWPELAIYVAPLPGRAARTMPSRVGAPKRTHLDPHNLTEHRKAIPQHG